MSRPWGRRAALAALCLVLPVLAAAAQQRPEQHVAPNPNLVAEEIPPLPVALAERAAPYLEARSASLVDWHPTRREMLVATRFANVTQLHHVAGPGAARKQLTFSEEPVSRALYRPGGEDDFVFARDIGGGEWWQLYWRDADSPAGRRITDGQSRNVLGPFSHNGRLLAYHSTRRTGRDYDLYLVDPANPRAERRLAELEGSWTTLDWSPDDRHLLLRQYFSVNDSRLHLANTATGAVEPLLSDVEGPVSYATARFSRDGRGVYFTSDQDSEFRRLRYLDLGSSQVEVLTPEIEWDVDGFDVSDNNRWLAFTVNEAGSSRLHLLDLRRRRETPLPELPLGVISGLAFHRNSRDLGFTFSSARTGTDVYSLDVSARRFHRWTESETGGLDADAFSAPELIEWRSFDDLAITGFLYRPPERFTGPRPVIVSIHGGPESQFRPRFLGRVNFHLNELGVAVIYPNVRGSTGFGKTFVRLDNAEKREDSVRDIGALLDWIAAQPDLDAERVLVTGGSYGGYMTYAVMTHYNDRVRCAVALYGISDFVTFLQRTEAYRRDLRRAEYGDERDPEMRAFLERIAPVNNAARITKPIFIYAGKNDPRVPLQESEQMVERIRANGGTVWYLVAQDEGHGLSKKANADFHFLATIRFIEEHLLR